MSQSDHTQPAVPFAPRASDDIFHRVQHLAEARAIRNQRDPLQAGRMALSLLKLVGPEKANLEHVISTAAGEFVR